MADTVRAIIIHATGIAEEIQLKRKDWVNHASELMDGAFIQRVANIGGAVSILADEDGLNKGLPINVAATSIINLYSGRECYPLVGPIIFTGIFPSGSEYPTDLDDRMGFENEG